MHPSCWSGVSCNQNILAETSDFGRKSKLPMIRLCFIVPVLLSSWGCVQSKKETLNSMPNPGTYFEIPVTDFERAVSFYEAICLCELRIQNIDGNRMAIFPGSPSSPGIIGALAMGTSYKPSMDGSRIYLHTDSIDATLQLVRAHGGRVEYPKTSIGDLGWVAEFVDTEGNRIALHSL
jgi:uncharacterized protein